MTVALVTNGLPLVLVNCRECTGSGELVTHQCWSDGMLLTKQCRVCEGEGHVLVDEVLNTDEVLDDDALARWEAA